MGNAYMIKKDDFDIGWTAFSVEAAKTAIDVLTAKD